MPESVSPALTGLTLGIALAGAPGAVQAVLLAEAIRGGTSRGLRALAGAHLTFGLLLVGMALGFSLVPPGGSALQIMKVAGGVFLLWLAVEGVRSVAAAPRSSAEQRTLPPAARGALAVLLNPGAWLFLGAVASPLLASAVRRGGVGDALIVALALITGAAIGDVVVVVVGGVSLRRADERLTHWVRYALASVLAGLAVWLIASGVMGT